MGQYEWLVITCRACRRVVKLPPAMAGRQVICPHCRTKIKVAKDAPVIEEAQEKSHIPGARIQEDATNLRGREEWEVGQRQIGGELNFKERLHSTADPEMQRDPHRKKHRRPAREEAVPEFDDPSRRRRRRRRSRSGGGDFAKTMTNGLIVAIVLLLGVIAYLTWKVWYPKGEPLRSQGLAQQEPPAPTLGSDGREQLELRRFSDYGPALAAAVRKFAAAASVDELLPLVRDRERVEPKMRSWHTGPRAWRPMEINNKFEPNDSPIVDGEFIIVDLQFPNGDSRPLTLERAGDTFLADWESFTGYSEMSWEELREKMPQSPVLMRVVVERSPRTEYWDGVFSDHTSHHCYLLRDRESNHFLSGYAKKDTAPDVTLRRSLKPVPPAGSDLTSCHAVVRISYPPGSANKQQVLIEEVMENGWVFRSAN
jgi:hypothetical protein